MANPANVVDLDLTLEQFQAAHAVLLQQHVDRSTTIVTADARDRVIAEWLNLVDDFMLASVERFNAIAAGGADVPTWAEALGEGAATPGDGSANPQIAANDALELWDATVRRAELDFASNDLRVRLWDTDGTTLRGTLSIDAAATPILAWDGRVALNANGEANAAADDLVIGRNSISEVGASIISGSTSWLAMGTSTNPLLAGLYADHGSTSLYLRANNGNRIQLGSTVFRPVTDNWTTLGGASNRWAGFHAMAATLYGDLTLGGTGGPREVVGTGSPEGVVTAPVGTTYRRTDGGSGTTLYVKEAGTDENGWVAVAPGAGVTDHGALTGLADDDHSGVDAGNGYSFGAGTVVDNRLLRTNGTTGRRYQQSGIEVSDTDAVSGVTTLDASTSIHASQYIELDEQASVSTPASGDGRLWLRNDSVVLFIDDAGRNHPLSLWQVAINPYVEQSALTGGTGRTIVNGHPLVTFPDETTSSIDITFRLPRTYAGESITVAFEVVGTGTSGNVVWQVSLERNAAGDDIDADSFGTPQSATAAPSSTSGVITIVSIANVSSDAANAGAWMRLRIERLGASGSDTFADTARLGGVLIYGV